MENVGILKHKCSQSKWNRQTWLSCSCLTILASATVPFKHEENVAFLQIGISLRLRHYLNTSKIQLDDRFQKAFCTLVLSRCMLLHYPGVYFYRALIHIMVHSESLEVGEMCEGFSKRWENFPQPKPCAKTSRGGAQWKQKWELRVLGTYLAHGNVSLVNVWWQQVSVRSNMTQLELWIKSPLLRAASRRHPSLHAYQSRVMP